MARALFLRLLEVGTVDQDITRHRLLLTELDLEDAEKTRMLREVWMTFTEQRLLTTSKSAEASTIEVSHEALIRARPRLKEWLQEPVTYEDMHFQRELRNDIAAWIRHNKPTERLYRHSQLKSAQVWSECNLLNQTEAGFLQASLDQQRKEKQQLTRRILIVSTIGIIASGGLIGSAVYISQDHHTNNPASVPQSLPYIYPGHTQAVHSVAWSPDGKFIASGGEDRMVQVWNASTGNILQTYKGHQDFVSSVAWSPDGKLIASGGADTTVQVWNATTGNILQTYRGHQDRVNSAVWSLDGKLIASGGYDTTVQIWEMYL